MKQSTLPHATPGYAGTAIFLHWLAALLVGGTFALGLLMTDIPGLTPPTWQSVLDHEYEAWGTAPFSIDTAVTSKAQAVALITETLLSRAHLL